ncbi:cyanophycinase-like [Daphnia carinata]|uniref:cyanophycinase-like n=1 Tax=Daphnia carinata TaxID=120202 RepID=UPI00257FF62C|nr:cyanophycinase-like [Daphnia carinata]
MYFVAFLLILPGVAIAQSLVLIGGNLKDDNAGIWTTMVEKAGGPGIANIGVILASPKNGAEGAKAVDNFVRIYGAKAASIISLEKADSSSQEVADRVRSYTGIFLVDDSEKSNLVNVLRPSGVDSLVLKAIKSVMSNGGMVAGNSAIMGNSVVTHSGDSINALVQGTKYQRSFSGKQFPLAYCKHGGLGFLNNYVLDSHFSDQGREMRLIRTLLDSRDLPYIGTPKGLGVDENTALVISNPLSKPVGKVITAEVSLSGVFFVDVSTVPAESSSTATYEKIPFSFFTVNDTIDLTSGEATYASWKIPIAGEEWFEDAIPSSDIFSAETPSEWRQTNRRLIDCKEVNVTCTSLSSVVPRFQVFFDRLEAIGFGADIPNDPKKTYVASYRNMLATIKPVEA